MERVDVGFINTFHSPCGSVCPLGMQVKQE